MVMGEMTSHERFRRMFEHRPADRVPIIDSPWAATIERWRAEGLPAGASWQEFFGVDRVAGIHLDNSPRFEQKVLEETDEYRVHTTKWGQTLKDWKHAGGTPEFLHCTVVDRDSWAAARRRMTPSRDRIDWDRLERDYRTWRRQGCWIEAGLWFGFDVTHSWMVGTERLLMALIDDPEWCVDMFRAELELDLALLEMLWQAGYAVDAVRWPDDLGYKHSQFMSLEMYRTLLKPVQKRACEWAHARGAYVHLHSCGDVNPFVPEFVEIGVDCLNPLEVKAGMDPVALKRRYGGDLVLHGGINAVLWDDVEAIEAEIRRVVPAVKENGGYIFSSDHSVPSSVSLEDFRRIVRLARELGSYD
jgi:uroporphyrinogen decarboxylase